MSFIRDLIAALRRDAPPFTRDPGERLSTATPRDVATALETLRQRIEETKTRLDRADAAAFTDNATEDLLADLLQIQRLSGTAVTATRGIQRRKRALQAQLDELLDEGSES